MARFALTLTALLLIPLAPDATAASAKPRSLGTGHSLVFTDGTRYAVYKSTASKLTVRDDARRRRFRIGIDPACTPADSASSLVLLACGRDAGRFRLFVLDVRTRDLRQVPERTDQSNRGFDPNFEGFDRLGRRWLAGVSSSGGHPVRVYLDWRSGEKRTFFEEGTYRPRDLDSADLEPTGPERPEDFAFARVGSLAATPTARGDKGLPTNLTLFSGTTAKRLGTRVALLDRCSRWCGSVTVGGGLVSWAVGRFARAFVPRTRERLAWRFDSVLVSSANTGQPLQHTRTTVYAALYDRTAERYRLYAVKWR